jgi:hypothetical protein
LIVVGDAFIDNGSQATANEVDIVIDGGSANFGYNAADSITVNADGNLVINSALPASESLIADNSLIEGPAPSRRMIPSATPPNCRAATHRSV